MAAALLVFSACDICELGPVEPDKTMLSPEGEFVAPVLLEVGDITIDGNNSAEAVTFLWSAADFGAPVQIAYNLYFARDGKTALAGTSRTNKLTLSKADVNGILVNSLGVKANDAADVEAYVEASVNGTEVKSVRSTNSVAFNVQTFKAKLNSLFICGQFQNGWDVNNAPEFWETGGGTKIYKILIDYLAQGTITPGEDQGFKILTQRKWEGDYWGYSGLTPSWDCPENNDKNFQFGAAAQNIYLLTVNLSKKTISAEGIDALSLIGDFDESAGWSNDVDLVYDCVQNIWTAGPVTFSGGKTDFLIRYDHAWSKKLGGATTASEDVEGGFELVSGGDNMKVPSDGTYMMKIHGNRTPMVIVMEKQ